jgi:hypothetical protein
MFYETIMYLWPGVCVAYNEVQRYQVVQRNSRLRCQSMSNWDSQHYTFVPKMNGLELGPDRCCRKEGDLDIASLQGGDVRRRAAFEYFDTNMCVRLSKRLQQFSQETGRQGRKDSDANAPNFRARSIQPRTWRARFDSGPA